MKFKKNVGRISYILVYPIFRIWLYNSNRAYVLLIYNNQIILSQNWLGWKNEWSLPGGGIHMGEKAKNAVKREVFEELKLTIDPNKLIKLTNKPYRSKYACNCTIYKYELKKLPKISKSLEIYDAKLVDAKDLHKYKFGESTEIALACAGWKF